MSTMNNVTRTRGHSVLCRRPTARCWGGRNSTTAATRRSPRTSGGARCRCSQCCSGLGPACARSWENAMADRLERELHGLDAERPLPNGLYLRLEAALLEDAETRGVGADEDAAMFTALDAPRPIPLETRAALERTLTHGPGRRDRRSVLLAAAAAVLLVVGTVAALRSSESPPNRQVAVGPGRSVPDA